MPFEVSLCAKLFFANMAFIFFMGGSWYSFDGAKLSQIIFFCKVVVVVVSYSLVMKLVYYLQTNQPKINKNN